MRLFGTFVLVTLLGAPLASCKKEPSKSEESTKAFKEIEKTFDDTEPPAAERKPVAGADISKLDASQKALFESLADSLPSPCGKAHSLRTSKNTDSECKRAPFAVKYVQSLVEDGATENDVKELFALRFRPVEKKSFALSADSPRVGPSDAAVNVVEFFDYGCPACKMYKPVLEEAMKGMETDVALYFKQFPLDSHVDSPGAAQAAVAAHKQGKYVEMHGLLFGDQHAHKMDTLRGYVVALGLNMAQFEKDFAAAEAQVAAEKKEGIAAGVEGTPALFINGVLYEGPAHPKYFKMWLEEAAAGAL